MAFKQIAEIAGSAMSAQTVRMNTIASNLANAGTSGTEQNAYQARKPVFASVFNGVGARVQVVDVIGSQDPLERKYEPGNPLADDQGMVFYSNVNPVEEMADMMAASRAYSTNVEVLVRINGMQQQVLKMGEGA
ncbi:flagellar basal body rod protein FlgC [Xanthomonas sp. XNM01]|jgi:flagellar basal-body rod protein FlgC|uniref:flagellar basal body rod protein FlgC n=1 Tax=Xanthomonas sp. XNM01 TaxID=2769289 RepID=UPI0017818960|nr:flagellar basal body rod protein FlgC [Xanthomonas sp. XNM01]MBD9370962.1 flagellar basal body rod protein FlgC [Xanthomonas sp. XNM01]